jgi:hypothetical protein
MTDGGRPWGRCYEEERSLENGFCRLPLPGNDSIGSLYEGVLVMWLAQIHVATRKHIAE